MKNEVTLKIRRIKNGGYTLQINENNPLWGCVELPTLFHEIMDEIFKLEIPMEEGSDV